MKSKTPPQSDSTTNGLTQRAFLLMGANFTAMAISFVLPLILTRIMSQEQFGLYKQSFQILLTVLGLLNLQVAISMFYYMEREPEKKLQVIHNVIAFYGLMGVLVAGIFIAWPESISMISQSADLMRSHMWLLGLAIFFWLISTNLESAPIAAGDVGIASVLIVSGQFVRSVFMIVAALAFGTIDSILVAAILQGAVHIVLMSIYLRRRFGRLRAPFDWQLFKSQVGTALPFGLGSAVAVMQEDLHNYFVSSHYDAANFAIYAVGCFQLPLLDVLNNSFSNALNPEVAKHKAANNMQGIYLAWIHVVRSLAFVLVPAFGLMFVMRTEFITGLFTAQYSAAIPIFGVNLLMILLKISMHYPIMRAFDEFKYLWFKLSAVLLPVTFAALYLGWKAAGLVGIAVAVISVRTISMMVIIKFVISKLEVKFSDMRHLTPLLRISAAVMIAMLICSLVRMAILESGWLAYVTPDFDALLHRSETATEWDALLLLGFCSIVFSLVYLASAWVVGAVNELEKELIRNLLVKFRLRRPTVQPINSVPGIATSRD